MLSDHEPPSNGPITTCHKLLNMRDFKGVRFIVEMNRLVDNDWHELDQAGAISDVLSAAENRLPNGFMDYYGMIRATRLGPVVLDDFLRLMKLLDGRYNRFPCSNEAAKCALQAWSLLSKPDMKVKYDLAISAGKSSGQNRQTHVADNAVNNRCGVQGGGHGTNGGYGSGGRRFGGSDGFVGNDGFFCGGRGLVGGRGHEGIGGGEGGVYGGTSGGNGESDGGFDNSSGFNGGGRIGGSSGFSGGSGIGGDGFFGQGNRYGGSSVEGCHYRDFQSGGGYGEGGGGGDIGRYLNGEGTEDGGRFGGVDKGKQNMETILRICPYCYIMHEYEVCIRCNKVSIGFESTTKMIPWFREPEMGEDRYNHRAGMFISGFPKNSSFIPKEQNLGRGTEDVVVVISDDDDGEVMTMARTAKLCKVNGRRVKMIPLKKKH